MSSGAFDWFREGGAFMFVTLFVFLGAFAASVAHAVKPKFSTLIIAGGLAVGTFVAGLAGTMLGRKAVEDAVATVDPSMVAGIRAIGMKEAGIPIRFGSGLAVLASIPLAVGEVRRSSRR